MNTTPIGRIMRYQQQRIQELERRLSELERRLSPPAPALLLPHTCPAPHQRRPRRRPIAVGCYSAGKSQVIDLSTYESALSTGASPAQLMELAMADAKRAFVATMETRSTRPRPANPFAGIAPDSRLLPPGA